MNDRSKAVAHDKDDAKPVKDFNPFGGPPLKPETYGEEDDQPKKSLWKRLIDSF